MSGIFKRLNNALENGVEENVLLSSYSSFGIGGPARYFFTAHTTSELVRAIRAARAAGIRFFVLGGGSNILFDDAGFSGLVIKDKTDKFRINGGIVSALSGTIVDRLVDATVERGLGGMEYAAGIQGTIGGAVHGNAGAFGFAYRSSKLCSKEDTVLSVRLKLRAEDPLQLAETVKDRRKFRQERHPVGIGTAGSVFKNIRSLEKPEEVIPAGKLLDEAGMKGMKIGGAEIFEKHCNIIVNRGNARSEDVLKLIEKMKEAVFNKFGIDLEREILYIEP
jgi:UDP-N-acetylmuramate dehydrogenase